VEHHLFLGICFLLHWLGLQAALSSIHDDRMRTSDAYNSASAALMTAQHATQQFVPQDSKVSM
jgi:hypothetical protein